MVSKKGSDVITWNVQTVLRDHTNEIRSPSRSTVREYARRHIEYQCVNCLNTGKWWGFQMKLELHHINGNAKDNRIENLAFLCPNCHSLTEGFRGRKS